MSVDWSVLDWISRDIGVDEGVITEQRGENIQPAGFTIVSRMFPNLMDI